MRYELVGMLRSAQIGDWHSAGHGVVVVVVVVVVASSSGVVVGGAVVTTGGMKTTSGTHGTSHGQVPQAAAEVER